MTNDEDEFRNSVSIKQRQLYVVIVMNLNSKSEVLSFSP